MNQLYINPNVFEKVKLSEIDKKNKKFKYYEKTKNILENQYELEDIKQIIQLSHLSKIYIKHMQDFDTTILYKSNGHGVNHNIRVCFYAYIISTNEKILENDFNLIMESCKYHDIGRKNDLEDPLHGKRSSDKLEFLKNKYSEEEINYIKTIVTCHSLNDKEFEKIAVKNNVKSLEKCKKMHKILKDSDGLDRVRLHYPYVNIKYLRTETCKKMILFAHQLFYNYNIVLDN